jgi:hypothetical protein
MKFQLVSDLHLDVNINHPFSLPSSDIFTVIAGDVSAYMNDTVKWINSNVKNGVFIEGNHIGYNNKKHSIQYWETQLEKAFPIDANVSYLRNNFKIVDDVVFVGGILFTDYKLDGESNVYINKQRAMLYLNDFKYNKYNVLTDNPTAENDKYPNVKAITPSDYQKMFYETLGAIRGVCEKYTDEDGVYTADPRIIPTAGKVWHLSYDEMLTLAHFGNGILHPRAIYLAKE